MTPCSPANNFTRSRITSAPAPDQQKRERSTCRRFWSSRTSTHSAFQKSLPLARMRPRSDSRASAALDTCSILRKDDKVLHCMSGFRCLPLRLRAHHCWSFLAVRIASAGLSLACEWIISCCSSLIQQPPCIELDGNHASLHVRCVKVQWRRAKHDSTHELTRMTKFHGVADGWEMGCEDAHAQHRSRSDESESLAPPPCNPALHIVPTEHPAQGGVRVGTSGRELAPHQQQWYTTFPPPAAVELNQDFTVRYAKYCTRSIRWPRARIVSNASIASTREHERPALTMRLPHIIAELSEGLTSKLRGFDAVQYRHYCGSNHRDPLLLGAW